MPEKQFNYHPGVLVILASLISLLALSAFASAQAAIEIEPSPVIDSSVIDLTTTGFDVSEFISNELPLHTVGKTSVTDSVLAHAEQVYQANLAEGKPVEQAKTGVKETLTQFGVDESMATALLRRIQAGKIQAPAPVVLSVLEAMAK
ncbi:MAG: hypothetical protein K2X01_10175 [Cyanobacteria bacterium]|nr:hypothetical protein [Cyanobacteriota bacterium]